MNRDDDLDAVLTPWMARNAPAAPVGLLQRIMAEVDVVEQRTTRWPSWSAALRPSAVVASAALLAVLVMAVGLAILNRSPAPATTPDADLAYVQRYLGVMHNGTAEEFAALYAPDAMTFSPETGAGVAQGREEIAAGFKTFHDYGSRVVLSGEPSRDGPFLTFRFTWENGLGYDGTGVTTLLFDERGLITYESTLIEASSR